MFANLFFLILILLTINIGMETSENPWKLSPFTSFFSGFILYSFLLSITYNLTSLFKKRTHIPLATIQIIINCLFLIYIISFHLILASHQIYKFIPIIGHTQTFFALISISSYFFILGVMHYSYTYSTKKTHLQLRFLLPFVLPFILFSFFFDLLSIIPFTPLENFLNGSSTNFYTNSFFYLLLLSSFFLLILFFPVMVQKIWLCKALPPSPLLDQLNNLCRRADFKHGGFKIWTVMNHAFTAAIMGTLPNFRYIMFTENLLRIVPDNDIEAILAHEIGHSQKKHLLYYPLILFGLMILLSSFSLFFFSSISDFFFLSKNFSLSPIWQSFASLSLFLLFIALLFLYFRIVFGYFSRIFERQADIHGYYLKVPVDNMISALDTLGNITGNSHKEPNWHHYSIQERIDFLNLTKKDPKARDRHNKKVKYSLRAYFLFLFLGFFFISLSNPSSSTTTSSTPFIKSINDFVIKSSNNLSFTLNQPFRKKITKNYLKKHPLKGDPQKINKAFEDGLQEFARFRLPGIAEFYASQKLLEQKELSASATLMKLAWLSYDFNYLTEEALNNFQIVSNRILQEIDKKPHYIEEKIELTKTINQIMNKTKNNYQP